MSDNQFNYSGINYQGRSLHDIIKNQENIINQLKLQIQVQKKKKLIVTLLLIFLTKK